MLAKKPMGKIKESLFLILILLGACQDQYDPPIPMAGRYESQPSDIRNQISAQVAKNLALSLSDVRVRNFLKQKAFEKFDGDYNFLIQVERNTVIIPDESTSPALTFGDVIAGRFQEPNESDGTSLLNSIQQFVPLLQVALRQGGTVNIDWDMDEIPLVAFVPTEIKDGIIPAFDSHGNYHELSSDKAPNSLTVVVSENERLIVMSKHNDTGNGLNFRTGTCPIDQVPYFEDGDNQYYYSDSFYDEQNECTGGGSSTGSESTDPTGCDRDMKTGKDRLNKMIFNSINAFKQVNDWFDGGQELEVTVFFAQANGSISKVTKVFYGKDHDFRDCGIFNCHPEWFGLGNAEIVTWDKSMYGNSMLYLWTEKDPGNPVKITTGFSVTHEISDGTKAVLDVEVSKTITNNDDILGESIVEYCDNTDGEGFSYVTGAITFLVRQ